MRQFQLLALGRISRIEREVKHTLVNNMLLFTKFSEVMVSQLGDQLKQAIIDAAIQACDSHPWIGKAEFSVLCMKFGNNQLVTKTVQYLEKKISKMIDFD